MSRYGLLPTYDIIKKVKELDVEKKENSKLNLINCLKYIKKVPKFLRGFVKLIFGINKDY